MIGKSRTFRTARPQPRGFLLIEMVALVGLLAVFSIILAALFKVAYRAEVDSAEHDALLHSVDAAMACLRRDTWNARDLQMEGTELHLTLANGDTVRWQWSRQWTRTQTGAHSSVLRWNDMGAEPVTAEVNGALVTLHLAESPQVSESIPFASQVRLGRLP